MTKKHNNYLLFLFLILFIFNVYYFLISKSSNLYHHFEIIFNNPSDRILELNIYRDLREEYSNLNKLYTEDKIVFVGDSITKRFNIQEFSQNYKIINRGIFFDNTKGLLDRIDSNINNIKVDTLFLMIGFNDLKLRSDSEILHNFKLILLKIRANKIFIQSILPVSSEMTEFNDRICRINEQLKIITEEKNLNYIDLHSHFKTADNSIKPELTSDGVHPNFFGYELWFSLIEQFL